MTIAEYLANQDLVNKSKAVTLALRQTALVLHAEETGAAAAMFGASIEWFYQQGFEDDQIREMLEQTLAAFAEYKAMQRPKLELVKP